MISSRHNTLIKEVYHRRDIQIGGLYFGNSELDHYTTGAQFVERQTPLARFRCLQPVAAIIKSERPSRDETLNAFTSSAAKSCIAGLRETRCCGPALFYFVSRDPEEINLALFYCFPHRPRHTPRQLPRSCVSSSAVSGSLRDCACPKSLTANIEGLLLSIS